jgi:hypothetical protein
LARCDGTNQIYIAKRLGIRYDPLVIAQKNRYAPWVTAAIAAGTTLVALELMDRFSPVAAYVGGIVVLIVVVVRLLAIAFKQP